MVSLLKEAVSLLRDQPQSLKRLLLLHQQLILKYFQIVSILYLIMSLGIVNELSLMGKFNCRMLLMRKMMMMLTSSEKRLKRRRKLPKRELLP